MPPTFGNIFGAKITGIGIYFIKFKLTYVVGVDIFYSTMVVGDNVGSEFIAT